jgi:hypothetical protein
MATVSNQKGAISHLFFSRAVQLKGSLGPGQILNLMFFKPSLWNPTIARRNGLACQGRTAMGRGFMRIKA